MKDKRLLIVTGTQTTTTSAMCAWILDVAGLEPGWAFGDAVRPASSKRKIIAGGAKPAPFVTDAGEGADAESTVILTRGAPEADLVDRIGPDGLIVCDAREAKLVAAATSRVAFYALEGDDTSDVTPTWLGIVVPPDPVSGAQPFDVFLGGSAGGRFALSVPGAENVRNAVAALAACAEGFGVDIEKARAALTSFKGVPA